MAENSLSPAFIKLNYGRTGVSHVATYATQFLSTPTPGTAPALKRHDGGSALFTTAMEDWADLLAPLFNTGMSFASADVWSQPTPADDPIWIFTHTLGTAGSSSSPTVTAMEDVMSFRTSAGGAFKLYFMETISSVNIVQLPGGYDTNHAAISDFVIGNSSWLYGRDNGRPIAALSLKTKFNDVLRRKLLTG